MAKKKARTVKISPDPMPITEPSVEPTTAPEPPVETKPKRVTVGAWAYIFGIVIALAAAVFIPEGNDMVTYSVLAVLGLVVGFMNIRAEEVLLFLLASVSLVVSANSVRSILVGVPYTQAFLNNLIVFIAAGAFIVSIKALFQTAKDE